MAAGSLSKVVHHLRRAVLSNDDSLTDGQLLEYFHDRDEEAAFEALMRRHGPMVMGVCRRILQNSHDAEDVFQATFLVLVRKAASLVGRKTVGNWLFGVAYHTALKARAAAVKRRAKEQHVKTIGSTNNEGKWQELQQVLDQELERLPEPYREAIVLCDLEGKSRKDAARRLGWPEGTLSGRLSRARALLGKRLARHGITVSGGMLAMVLAQQASSACVPAPLIASTLKAAATLAAGQAAAGALSTTVAALTQGAMKAMLIAKLKIATFVVLGVGLLAMSSLNLNPGAAQDNPGKKKKANIVEVDLNKLPPDLAKRLLDQIKAKGSKSGENRDENDGKKKSKEPAKKSATPSSGFQGEQQGQHEDKEDAKKPAKKAKGSPAGKGDQQGQHEDKEDGKKKAPAKKGNKGQNEDNTDGKKNKKRNDDDVSLIDGVATFTDRAGDQPKESGQQNQQNDGQKNHKDDGQKNQKDDGQKNQKDDSNDNQQNDGGNDSGQVRTRVTPAPASGTSRARR